MEKDEKGNVTLTKKEFTELHKAYQKLMDILGDFPSSLEDFMDSHAEYLRVCKWECLLAGKKFSRRDYE